MFSNVEKNAEKITGLTLSQIKKISPEKFRVYLEQKNKKKFSFTSEFPIIGRGNVLRDSLVDTQRLNCEIDRMLGVL